MALCNRRSGIAFFDFVILSARFRAAEGCFELVGVPNGLFVIGIKPLNIIYLLNKSNNAIAVRSLFDRSYNRIKNRGGVRFVSDRAEKFSVDINSARPHKRRTGGGKQLFANHAAV